MLKNLLILAFLGYILAVFGMYYVRLYRQLPSKRFFTFKTLKFPIGLILVIAVPLLVINVLGFGGYASSLEDSTEGEEQLARESVEEKLRKLERDSLNVDLHYEIIRTSSNYGFTSIINQLESDYENFIASSDQKARDLAYTMKGMIDYEMERPIEYWNNLDQVEDTAHKYLNFGYGVVYYREWNFKVAELFLLKELNYGGFGEGAVPILIDIYSYKKKRSKIKELAYNPDAWPYMDSRQKRDIYIRDGEMIPYYREVLVRHQERLNIWGLIGALLASLVWILYLRNLDVFEPEKWVNIIMIFLAGGVFAFLIYPLSDVLEIYFNLDWTGGWWNDFVYSTVVIGLVEEITKFLPWFLLLAFTRVIDEPFDYILYASLSAGGFAFTENLIYFQESDLHVIYSRATYCIVGHMFDASIIAYAFVLFKYQLKSKLKYWYVIPLGFVVASLSHGIYDFFIFKKMGILSMLFFLICMHFFVVFQNNALNISNHFSYQTRLNTRKIGTMLILGLITVFMYQYTAVGLRYGAGKANELMMAGGLSVTFMLAFLTHTFTQIRIVKGVWNRVRMPHWCQSMIRFSRLTSVGMGEGKNSLDLTGLKMRFFAPKDNPFVGSQFPVTGSLGERIEVSGDDQWYLVHLDSSIQVNECLTDKAIVRHKNEGTSLSMDKVLIYFMMIPDEYTLRKETLLTKDLIFTGRVYSRVIEE